MESPRFDARCFELRRAALGLRLGTPLTAVAETGSTNDDALRAAAQGAPSGAVFVADAQTHGRGRRGRRWTSPPGEDLTFTLLLRPGGPAAELGCLPLVVGLSVRAAVAQHTSAAVGVKWPNDVYAAGRKIAGILVESHVQGTCVEAVAVGVGINIGTVVFPDELAHTATSLAALEREVPGREVVLGAVLGELELRLGAFEEGGLASLIDELRQHDLLAGREVSAEGVRGIARGIGNDGALRVEALDGRVHAITSGTVEWEPGNVPV